MVAAQARQVEVQAFLLGEPQQLVEPGQRLLVGLVRAVHELAELQVDANGVGSQLLHLAEVRLEGRPLLVPIVLDEPPLVIVVVVEAPQHEGATGRVEDESLLVLGDGDPRHLVRLRLGSVPCRGCGRFRGRLC